LNFRRGVVLDEQPSSQFLLRRGLGDADAGAVDVLHRIFGGVRNGREAPLELPTFVDGRLVEREAGAAADGEEGCAVAEVGLVAKALEDFAGATFSEQVLEEANGSNRAFAV